MRRNIYENYQLIFRQSQYQNKPTRKLLLFIVTRLRSAIIQLLLTRQSQKIEITTKKMTTWTFFFSSLTSYDSFYIKVCLCSK